MHGCEQISPLIIQDMIILPGYRVLYCVCYTFWMSCVLYLLYPGYGEVPEWDAIL